MVKFSRSALAARGSPVWILGADMAPFGKSCCGRRPTYKEEEDGHGCELRASLPQQKRRRTGSSQLRANLPQKKNSPFSPDEVTVH